VIYCVYPHSVDAVLAPNVLDPQVHAGDHIPVLRVEIRERRVRVAERTLLDIGVWARERSAHTHLRWCRAQLVVGVRRRVKFCCLVEWHVCTEWRRQRRRRHVVNDNVQEQVYGTVVQCLGQRGGLAIFR